MECDLPAGYLHLPESKKLEMNWDLIERKFPNTFQYAFMNKLAEIYICIHRPKLTDNGFSTCMWDCLRLPNEFVISKPPAEQWQNSLIEKPSK